MGPTPSTFAPITRNWTITAIGPAVPAAVGAGPIPATVPGEVHTDLLRAGLIDDPFDGNNEAVQQWIGDTSWCYETTFSWTAGDRTRHDLVAYGLDTVATIELNGSVLARTANQHRSYRFDARPLLVEGENSLRVTFAAPVPETLARAEEHGALPHVNHHAFNQLRKMASSFGWDWGIDVAGAGIWKPIGIDSWTGVRIASVRPLAGVDGADGTLTCFVEIERDGEHEPTEETAAVAVGGITATAAIAPDVSTARLVARVPSADLWWPAGHGAQPLYDTTVTVRGETWTGRVGFRHVSVDTTPDADGIPFTLHVNGAPVIVRGVNWIPDHALLTQLDRDRYSRRLNDALEANVNLVRVWGGGIYESEDFYDLADERGLLVWQDFLLACAAYAEEEHLSAEIRAEAREQITRLSPHPSLVIWNGNNENIWGSVDWGWAHQLAGRTWGNGYYRELFPRLLQELDPTRFYSPASPYSFGEYRHPNDERAGTVHIWDVWNTRDYTVYRDYAPRFVSEFGFQGPPAWSTLTRVVHDEPLDPYGEQMLVHQKANRGNEKLARGYAGHLPEPRTIADWHWAAQLNQAHAIRFGVEHFRSLAPHNSGTILWQLNDNWPVVSWAAVDFDGHRKPLWYALRDAYAPRLATLQPRSSAEALANAFEGYRPELDTLALVLLNDTDEAARGSFTVSRRRLDGTLLAQSELEVRIAARGQQALTIPAGVASFEDASTEILVAEPATGLTGFARAILNGAEIVDQRLDPAPCSAVAARTPEGYSVSVTARSLVRDVFLGVDRVDPRARVDLGLVTLLAGESVIFRVASDLEVHPEAFLDVAVLRTANSLR